MLIVYLLICFFFFNDTATTEIYTLSLHDALPIFVVMDHARIEQVGAPRELYEQPVNEFVMRFVGPVSEWNGRSEEHTSELQSRQYLVCRLLLEKKKTHNRQKTVCDITY